ncbi:mucin-2-like isoform X1 [Melanotaenia boesemani]|uniref:mucin-2-like isoform X1 n=1 Tax=Melanotaenia boesemani TaxID=1250792 RepID=UPI001C05441B|nr:mucin-2-like isoform X1 [Melanotaenia boesemani]
MRMKVYVFLMMNLAVSSAASIGPTEPDVVDLTPLVNGSALACPKTTVNISQPPMPMQDAGPCSSSITTTMPPPTTTHDRMTTTMPPPTTTDGSIFGFSPAMVASPVLIVLLALVLLVP